LPRPVSEAREVGPRYHQRRQSMIATAYHEAFPEGSRQYEKYYEDSAQFTPRVCSHYPSPSDSTSTRDRRTPAPYHQASGPATEDQIMKTAEASSRARSKSLAQDVRTENNFLESGFTRVSRSPQRLPSTATSAGGREVTYVLWMAMLRGGNQVQVQRLKGGGP